jgi:Ca-activated chloride channel homolog
VEPNAHGRILGLLAAGTVAALFGAADARTADGTPTFSSGVEMVNLTVTVTDGRNALVSGLSQADFQIVEDGVPQQLAVFSRERLPLSLAILMDTSSSMEGRMPTAQAAALRLVRSLAPGDEVQVIHFNQRAAVVQPFTSDLGAVAKSIESGRPAGATALYTALYVALKDLAARRNPAEERRQAVVVLSDGDDTVSSVSDAQVMEVARRSNIAVYGISLTPRETLRSPDLNAKRGAFFLPELSRATGGLTHFPAAVSQLDGVYDRIAEELRTQYSLGYVSTNAARNGGWRKIAIRTPTFESLQLRYKPGYFAAR